MPEQLQVIIEAVKDYGAAIISTISVGGVAAVGGIIMKIKKAFDETKETMNKTLEKKDEIINSTKNQLSETSKKMDVLIDQNAELAKDNKELKEILTKVKK